MISGNCTKCNRKWKSPEQSVGKIGTCRCGNKIEIVLPQPIIPYQSPPQVIYTSPIPKPNNKRGKISIVFGSITILLFVGYAVLMVAFAALNHHDINDYQHKASAAEAACAFLTLADCGLMLMVSFVGIGFGLWGSFAKDESDKNLSWIGLGMSALPTLPISLPIILFIVVVIILVMGSVVVAMAQLKGRVSHVYHHKDPN